MVARIEVLEGLKRSSGENWLERNMFVCVGREGKWVGEGGLNNNIIRVHVCK